LALYSPLLNTPAAATQVMQDVMPHIQIEAKYHAVFFMPQNQLNGFSQMLFSETVPTLVTRGGYAVMWY